MNKKTIYIVIGILVLIFIGYKLTQDTPSVSNQLNSIEVSLAECNQRIDDWTEMYGAEEPRSEEADDVLNNILSECQEVLNDAEAQI